MDWLAKLLDLPEDFLSTGKGGGVIQVYILYIYIWYMSYQDTNILI